jgi:hypothetical protein
MPVADRRHSRPDRDIAKGWWKPAAMLLCFALPATPTAFAQGVVIYRCTDANGALTIQNDTPCPKGSKQDRRVMEAAHAGSAPPVVPPPAPKPVVSAPRAQVPPPPVAPPPPTESEPAIADSDRLPPPWLYECHTENHDSYLSEDGAPAPRCVTLDTRALGGIIATDNVSACEMKIDQCQRVPDGALCDSWRKRLREAESALRFGASEDRAHAEAEVQRVTRVVRESTCGQQ